MITKEQYEINKKRLEKGDKQLEGHWSDPDPKWIRLVNIFSDIAAENLEYEIENDLLNL